MTELNYLVKRNIKMFFKDKGIFFTSLITPIILLVLYATFLANVYKESYMSTVPEFLNASEELINGMVGGQLFSSLLAVSTITVAFCSNMLMVQDKVTMVRYDFNITPTKNSVYAWGYYISTAITTLIVSVVAIGACLIYLANVGWYLSLSDIIYICIDVIILVMLGTALSSVVNFFLSSQGQISAVGSIVSSGYGFICGAYMPISQLGVGVQKIVSFLPGTYGTSLLRNHALAGVFREMEQQGFPSQAIEGIKETVDCTVYFADKPVSVPAMYCIIGAWIAILVIAYIFLNIKATKNK